MQDLETGQKLVGTNQTQLALTSKAQVDEIMMNDFGDCDWADDHSCPLGNSDIASDGGMNAEFNS